MAGDIAIFYCFPRSGGTLLSQCLLCAPRNVVFSEINPAGSMVEPEKQAAEWFDLAGKGEVRSLSRRSYIEKIALFARRCKTAKKHLCIRDWPAINFVPDVSPLSPCPSGLLEQQLYLRRAGYPLHEAALVRRSQTMYDSLRHHIPSLRNLSPTRFASAYKAYLQALGGIPRFQLEQLQACPEPVLREICTVLGLDFAPDFASRFHLETRVTGNNTLPEPPPSAGWETIQRQPACTQGPASTPAMQQCFAELDLLAGYKDA